MCIMCTDFILSVIGLLWIWNSLFGHYRGMLSDPKSLTRTKHGNPHSIGRVKLFWLRLSCGVSPGFSFSSIASLNSYFQTRLATTYTASNSAIRLPRHDLGPPLKTGNSKALIVFTVGGTPFLLEISQRSGLNSSASSPQMCLERPMAQGVQITMAPAGREVPSGNVVGVVHSLSSMGTGG